MAVDFTQEWVLLHQTQRDLHKNVMLEYYRNLVALGKAVITSLLSPYQVD
jgi:hypothetical protein